jgi:hypothetical protein
MTVTLVLPDWIAHDISDVAQQRDEAGAVLLAGVVHSSEGLRLLGRELHWVPDEAYDRRTSRSLSIRSEGYVAALARAEKIGATPIWLHTHPGSNGIPIRSEYDEVVDDALQSTFRIRSGSEIYASLVFSPAGQWFRFTGDVWEDGEQPTTCVTRTFIVGPRWSLLAPDNSPVELRVPTLFDRQVRAFGGGIQRVLSQLRVGVVGCGGTGSAVSEQLTRLGIRSLLLIDPEELSESNVTRVYGSTPAGEGYAKVDVLADHLEQIAPDATIERCRGTITAEPVARLLAGCDVVFGCTDDNAGRLILSRFSSYYLTPVIDAGVLLSSSGGQLEGIDGRITVLSPGAACLVCRGRVDLARAQAELLDPDEREALQAEGYAPELGQVEPAVVPYTSMVASFAVAELLERFIGYGPEVEPGELLIRCHEREVRTNSRLPTTRHYCDPAEGLLGYGDRTPFLGQTWRVA